MAYKKLRPKNSLALNAKELIILSKIKKYLKQREQASLEEVAIHFNSDPGATEEMLGLLMRKGVIEMHTSEGHGCNGCGKCLNSKLRIYHWVVKH
ncbi:MAG: FeoC-like transcriptional regulator [Desulfotalea sp.]